MSTNTSDETQHLSPEGEGAPQNTPQGTPVSETQTTDPTTSPLIDAAQDIDLNAAEQPELTASLQATIMELEDRLKRALAEQQNQRQRMLKEKSNAERFGAARLATDLFDVIDNLDRALQSVPFAMADDPNMSNLITGVQMVQQQMLGVLNTHNIKAISPLGEKVDFNLHETIAESDTDPSPAQTIINVAQVGYIMHDRLLRPAKVVISSGRGATTSTDDGSIDQQV